MANDQATTLQFSMDPKALQTMVQETLRAHILSAFASQKDLIMNAIIDKALKEKVSSSGNVSQYSSDNTYTYLEVVFNKMIRESVAEVTKELAQEIRPQIKKKITDMVKKSPAQYAGKMADAVLGALENTDWACKLSVEVAPKEK